jgi:hypothetical protein
VTKIFRRWYKLAALAPLLFLTACAKNAPQDVFQPEG